MEEPQFLTVKEAADLLRVSPVTVYRMAQKGEIPSYRVGSKRIVFDREELVAWVKNRDREGGNGG